MISGMSEANLFDSSAATMGESLGLITIRRPLLHVFARVDVAGELSSLHTRPLHLESSKDSRCALFTVMPEGHTACVTNLR